MAEGVNLDWRTGSTRAGFSSGIYLTEIKEGTPGERYVAVPKDVQKASLAWILNEYRNADWLSKCSLVKKFPMGVDMATVLRSKLVGNLTKLKENVLLSAHIASNPYTTKEFLNDLYDGTFESAIKGTKLTDGDKLLQNTLVDVLIAPLAEEKKSGGLFGLDMAYAPSVDEILAYDLDPTGMVGRFEDQLRKIESENGAGFVASQLKLDQFGTPGYGFLQKVDTKALDDSNVYLIDLAFKAQKLINSKAATSTGEDRLHYQALAAKISKTLKNK